MENPLLNEKTMTILDENNNEHIVQILFTYENEERQANYVFFYEEDKPDEIYVMRYLEDGSLQEIEDEDEYAEADEVLQAYNEDPKIQEAKD